MLEIKYELIDSVDSLKKQNLSYETIQRRFENYFVEKLRQQNSKYISQIEFSQFRKTMYENLIRNIAIHYYGLIEEDVEELIAEIKSIEYVGL